MSAVTLVVLAAAVWRAYHLLADDMILNRPRDALLDRLAQGGREARGIAVADFIACPLCLGFWVALAWTLLYAAWPEGAFWIALPFALNAAAVLIEDLHSRD